MPQARGCQGSDGTYTGTEVTSQEYTDLDAFSAVADDFRCAGSRKARTVKHLTWQGGYYSGVGPADSFNVRVYRNDTSGSIDEPGKIKCEYPRQGYTASGYPVIFKTTLSGKCVLKKHVTYWLSIQGVLAFGATGQYGWSQIAETNGNAADWLENGAFGTACTTWTNDLTLDDCIDFEGDFIFSFD